MRRPTHCGNRRRFRSRAHSDRVSGGFAAKAPAYTPPPPPPAFSWTGCYLGGYAGGAGQSNNGAEFTDLGNTTRRSFSGGVSRVKRRTVSFVERRLGRQFHWWRHSWLQLAAGRLTLRAWT